MRARRRMTARGAMVWTTRGHNGGVGARVACSRRYIQNRSTLGTGDLGKDLAVAAVAAWIFGPPINHFANGPTGTAFGGLGLRVGAFVVPVTLGLLLAHALNYGSIIY